MKAPWKGELAIRDRHPEAAIVDLVDERGEPVVLAVNRLVAAAIVERCSSELEFITDRDPGDEGPAVPKLYRNRCGWCGAFEGTVDPNEPCPIDEDGDPLGPHQFGIYEAVTLEGDADDAEASQEVEDDCPF